MDTFLARAPLVLSTVALPGRWNRWPSSLSRASAGQPAAGSPEPPVEAAAEEAQPDPRH